MRRTLKSSFPGLSGFTADYIEVHDPVLIGPARWSVMILVDNTTFKYEPLWRSCPIVVKFSNLQVWAASRALPRGTRRV